MSKLEKNEIDFEKSVDRLDKLFMRSTMTQREYDQKYKELKETFGFN